MIILCLISPPATPVQKRSNAGFTLVELLIAMALFALITSTAYSGLMQILRANKALDDERDVGMISNAVINRITREIQLMTPRARLLPPAESPGTIYPPSVHILGTPESLSDNNSGDSITFVADEAGQYVPDGQTHTGVVQLTYRVEPVPADENPDEEEIFYLIRDEVPVINPPDKAYELRMTFPITKRLVSFKLRYFDSDADEWTDTWDQNRGRLPAMIHFALKIRSRAGKVHTYATDIAIRRP